MGEIIDTEQKSLIPFIDMDEPDDENLREWAKKNIAEDPETKLQMIEELRDMIYERGEVEPHKTDDAFLMRFLRARHFIVKMAHRLVENCTLFTYEQTYKTLGPYSVLFLCVLSQTFVCMSRYTQAAFQVVNYYNFKETTPEFFNVDLNRIIELGYDQVISVPPYLDQDGRRIVIFRMGKWDTSKFTTTELFQAVILIIEMALLEPRFQILGGQCIFDLSELSVSQAWYMSPTIAKQMLQVGFTSMPLRIHGIHILNHSWVFDIAFNVVKPLLGDFMRERIFFHNDNESLHKHIDPKHLPQRYGGVHKDYNYTTWINSFKGNDRIIEEITSNGYKGCREAVDAFSMSKDAD